MTFKVKKKREKLTERRLNYLIQDEKKSSSEYKKYGFKKLAKDEKSHQKYLQGIKNKRKESRDKYKDNGGMDTVDEVYDMGEDIVQRANPFSMAGRSLGYSDEAQENIRKGKHKVSSPYLKMLGQKDIPMKRRKEK